MIADTARFQTYFSYERDALLSIGDPEPLYRDLELHLLSIGVRHDPLVMQLLKDGLAALALYMVSRPRFETFGWTISLQDPPLNLFFTGSASESGVVGRAFHEHVQPAPRNVFFAQIRRPVGEPQTSSVEVEGIDLFGIVEQFCARSDQQPVRFFHEEGPRVALLSSLPDTDREWLQVVAGEVVFALESKGGLKLISQHEVSFRCGCDRDRITRVVAELYKQNPEDLFRGEPFVEAECPRCGTRHEITRERFDQLKTPEGPRDNGLS